MINDRREIRGWMMYDWANSAFSTTVVTALLGPYILALAASSTAPLSVFGVRIEPAAIFPFASSMSVLLQVLFLPFLGTIADFTNLKKRLMLTFAYIGAVATVFLFFIRADMPGLGTNGAVVVGSLLYILANLAFGAAVVSYNAFLPDIASPDKRDEVSSRGWAVGYLGGGLLLLINLGLLTVMEDTALAVRISLASAGVWWLVFTYLFPHKRLVQRDAARQLPPGTNMFKHGIERVWNTLLEMWRQYPMTFRYLIAYLIYNDGIQTVIIVSTAFAADELGVETQSLLLLVLMIQFVAFGGALAFGYLAKRFGAKRAIMVSLIIWSALVIYAFAFLYTETQLFVLGFVLALVLGGSQALSRSLFSQMIPADHEAEYFGFYEISERGTSWIGPLAFAAAVQITGSQRIAIVSLIIFFVVGLALLSRVNVRQAMLDSGNDPAGVVL
ncbi:MAG: MFS transporter [Chloroflexi bacterium]|nr:MFS transporter [Chloroflexota bacterium]MBK6712651.1 MFS transporter [Chloroflexota bacterium]MBK7177797.1 MFS transporter [Chloroflexota bacterium]MBK7916264.1 MFS transporter [Chloroflexota bacterium]MBK8930754.1 MFS transporter [Chloroflexota bacterium]